MTPKQIRLMLRDLKGSWRLADSRGLAGLFSIYAGADCSGCYFGDAPHARDMLADYACVDQTLVLRIATLTSSGERQQVSHVYYPYKHIVSVHIVYPIAKPYAADAEQALAEWTQNQDPA